MGERDKVRQRVHLLLGRRSGSASKSRKNGAQDTALTTPKVTRTEGKSLSANRSLFTATRRHESTSSSSAPLSFSMSSSSKSPLVGTVTASKNMSRAISILLSDSENLSPV